ncbi:MAG: CorA family divalent cation transporter [Burkholderiales bacterium]
MIKDAKIVRDFHHTLLWPITLRPLRREAAAGVVHYWDMLKRNPGPWKYVADTLLIEDETCLAGYEEFVHFLPYVQRFLYGVGDEGRGAQSSLYAFTREDIAKVEVELVKGSDAFHLDVLRARLYFFYDIDVAVAVLEVAGTDIPLAQAVELMDRFGRPYAPAWESSDRGAHCPYRVAFRGHDGALLSQSDYGDRDKFIDLVRSERQTPLSMHWEFFLSPLVPAYLQGGTIKYYQIENKRIPTMTYLSFDDPTQLSRGDMIRIGFAAKWGASDTLPYAKQFLADFESQYCYDRYWDPEDPTTDMDTRYIFCGVSFAMITKTGQQAQLLGQFRHQFYQIGLIANFNKAALLSLSNRFSRAVERLNVRSYESVKQFKKHVRETLEVFLRFNHRYWFHEISNQVQASDFFQRWSHQLGSDALYQEVREEARDINEYLDADRTRKQTDNAMRLTVVSSCGMVGTVVTGFLGMNLYSHSDLPVLEKILIFGAVFIPTTALALYTVIISRRIANFMEALSSEGLTWTEKVGTFRQIFSMTPRDRVRARRETHGLSSPD